MNKIVVYIHGKGGNSAEAEDYKPFFKDSAVIGLDYKAKSPWEVKEEFPTEFGETLSWEYLCYVRDHPFSWNVPTHIVYGEKDNLTSYETVSDFAHKIRATLTVMENGEHWFHTDDQLTFLDNWIAQFV